MLDPGSERLCLFIGDSGIVFTQAFQNKIGDIFYLMLPFLFATDIVDLSGPEVIYNEKYI